ncbi:MAG: hypothetical protein JXQ71_17845 [Verrucomicrobia bacterium]|nr:hypothetical protein [Verrucomicrobiota bacterium]
MKALKHWKIVVALLAVTLSSGLAGGLIGHRLARQRLEHRNNPENWNVHVAREFDRVVQPSPEQQPRLQAHLDRAVSELRQIRKETIARSTNVICRLIADVEGELTPEQRRAFEAFKPKPSDLDLDLLRVEPKP